MIRSWFIVTLNFVIIIGLAGCQAWNRVHYQAGSDLSMHNRTGEPDFEARSTLGGIPGIRPAAMDNVILATDFGSFQNDPQAKPQEAPAGSDRASKPASPDRANGVESGLPANAPPQPDSNQIQDEQKKPATAATPSYTVPSEAIRQLVLLTIGATPSSGSTPATSRTGKEFAESNAAVSGPPGLSTPASLTQGAPIVGPPGLQDGSPTLLGEINRTHNLFTPPIRNPISGGRGGCSVLARAGFFNRDVSACLAALGSQTRARSVHRGLKFTRK